MKRNRIIWTMLVLFALWSAGCGSSQDAVQKTDEDDNSDGRMSVKLEINKSEETEYKADDGTVIMTAKTGTPVVDIINNEEATGKINDFFKSNAVEELLWGTTLKQAERWAQEDYADRGGINWNAYAFESNFAGKRIDNKVISLVAEGYSYMGGAHPNTMYTAFNFDTQTGKQLELSDIAADSEEAAKAKITGKLLEQTKQEKYKDMFYENYEELLPEILTENTWYFGNDGFHVIGNPYMIAPYAAGFFDFVIPYDQADFLKESYRMK